MMFENWLRTIFTFSVIFETLKTRCEGAAATPYVPNLFYNDSRAGLTIYFGKPVPGISFVFHEWMCNFSGNMCYARHCDPFYRWTRAFHYGEMMSVILGVDGRLASAWGVPWAEDELDQDALVSLVRRLNDFRKRHSSFLLEGRMIRPFLKCESHSARITHRDAWYDLFFDTHEILVSFWENAKGERIGFASNWRREPSDLFITHADGCVETRTLAPLETIVVATAASGVANNRRGALYSFPASGGI